ncbi:MAG: putative glucose-6-phosphate 1-epimerase [Pseudomonadota bacterium]
MNLTADTFQGHTGWRWSLPNGDSVFVAQQGAQVLSWQAAGAERLYLSPASACDGSTAIRGGVPVCFPQFNQRGTLPKHGFVRNMPWQLRGSDLHASSHVFELQANDATRSIWPVDLQVHQLKISLRVENLGDKPLTFTGALHTYLAVSAIDQVCLMGQAKQAEWDAVQDTHQTCSGQLQFDAEFDRVYDVATTPSTPTTEAQAVPTWILQEGAKTLSISQSNAWGQSVVWNPGPEKTAQLKDMPANGFQHMLCVEAARVNPPIEVPAFQSWEAWQQFKL